MVKAASSEENVRAQADDHRLKASIRESIVATDPSATLAVTPYAYMGHAFLVGFVPDQDHADALVRRVRAIDGVRSVEAYLPIRPAERSTARDLELKAKVKSELALEPGQVVTRVEIEALAGHVVLLGVVRSPDAVESAGTLAARPSGVTGVTNFLLVPEPEYESLRPKLR
jgi:osmotically-inducible protein OsmY